MEKNTEKPDLVSNSNNKFITIGITTYNRMHIIERMAKSFYASDLCYPYHLRVYDDCSTELSEENIRDLFPDVTSVHMQEKNIGADANMRYMYEDFLKSGDEYFFNADSDLIFNRNWMKIMMETIPNTEGVLSAFNTPNHLTNKSLFIKDIKLVKKNDLGAAGTMFKRNIVEYIISETNNTNQFDWQWSSLLSRKGIELYSLADSVVQHIGFVGYNSQKGSFDYGENFIIDSITNGQIINDTVFDMSISKGSGNNEKYALFPFDIIPLGSNIIIYGAGKYGSDYYQQAVVSGMYNLVAMVDRNIKKFPIATICINDIFNYEFDYIIIAIGRQDIVNDVKSQLIKMGVDPRKIIDGCVDRIIRRRMFS